MPTSSTCRGPTVVALLPKRCHI